MAVLHKKGPIVGVDAEVARANELAAMVQRGEQIPEQVTLPQEQGEQITGTIGEASEQPTDERKKRAPRVKANPPKSRLEAPYFFVSPTDPSIAHIRDYFDLQDFPFHLLVVRSEGDNKRQLSFISEGIREILQAKNKDLLKVIHTGVKIFARNDHMKETGCDYRLGQEAIRIAQPHVRTQIVHIPEADFITMLNEEYPLLSAFSQPIHEAFLNTSTADFLIFSPVTPLLISFFFFHPEFGSCLIVFDPAIHGTKNCLLANKVYMAGWKGKNTGSSMVDKQERVSLLQRFENVKISDR